METAYFYGNFFLFTIKLLPIPQVFFEIFSLQHLVMLLTDLHQLVCSFTKKPCHLAIKRVLKNVLEVTKAIERLSKTPYSDCVFHIPTQTIIKDHNYVFEHDIFHNNLKDSVYEQVSSHKYSKQECNADFFVGLISPPKTSRTCHMVV